MSANFSKEQKTRCGFAGFSLVELLILVALLGTVSAIAVVRFQKSSSSLELQSATRNLGTLLEKARMDSVRRHGGASVEINSRTGYTANIDFSGEGSPTARTFTLPPGTTLRYGLPPATTSIDPDITPLTIAFNWRGRTTNTVLITLTDSAGNGGSSTVMVGPAGDLSTDTTVTGPMTTPVPMNTTVTPTTGIKSMR